MKDTIILEIIDIMQCRPEKTTNMASSSSEHAACLACSATRLHSIIAQKVQLYTDAQYFKHNDLCNTKQQVYIDIVLMVKIRTGEQKLYFNDRVT
jgi:hypothetical protein